MKSKLVLIAFLFLSVTVIARSQTADSLKYTVLTAKELQNEYSASPGAILIDARGAKDFKKSRIPGAVNIVWPLPENYFNGTGAPSKDKSLFIYCYVGNRSKKVASVFYDNGYKKIYSLQGGFNGWKKNKMPVDKKRHKAQDSGHREEP